MDSLSPAATRCISFDEWPAVDREKWQAALAQRHSPWPSRRGPFATLRPASIAKARNGYERWLGFLAHTGQLDPTTEPGDRITLPRFLDYVALLQACGNRGHTIYGRASELKSALRCLASDTDFAWLTSPGGVPLQNLLDMACRELETFDSKELFAWGLELMAKAISLNGPARRRVMLRDGLLLAILASRGIRLRTTSEMRLQKNVFRRDDRWFLQAEAAITKTEKQLAFPLPASLTPWLDRYVSRERPELLAGKEHDFFLVNWSGDPLASDGVTKRFYWLTEKRFGRDRRFGPHRMRHCLVTSAADSGQEVYAAAPALLGHTQRVAAAHYNRSDGSAAFVRFQEAIMDERARTEPLARNIFESRDPGRIGQATEEEDGF